MLRRLLISGLADAGQASPIVDRMASSSSAAFLADNMRKVASLAVLSDPFCPKEYSLTLAKHTEFEALNVIRCSYAMF